MIMPATPKHRIKLIIPPKVKGGKILKSCVRCRHNKTKCDAILTNPEPCSHCTKRGVNCTLDVISTLPKKSGIDLVEKLSGEVSELKVVLDRLVERKQSLIEALIARSQGILNTHQQLKTQKKTVPATPPISQIQSCLNSPVLTPTTLPSPPRICSSTDCKISSSLEVPPFVISIEEAYELFTNYEVNFNQFLPIFPESFFSTIDLVSFKHENELLFWSIIMTSYLNYPDPNSSSKYKHLTSHIKSLVVETCWMKTPRSVYVVSSLLILTTWPLPHQTKLTNNISIKFLTLMKNLSLQFGLHKLEFLNEFSHKTNMNVSSELSESNLIRERIYKFININSNYWVIYLGLASNNNNGSDHDYIINKASNIDILNKQNSPSDHYINALLKVCMIQSKLNENMSDLIGNSSNNESILTLPNQINTTKVINLKMFEVILQDISKTLRHDNHLINNLIQISINYSKLQLYIYSLSHLNISIDEYKSQISKICSSCFNLFSLYQNQFKDSLSSFNQLPIHYKFPIELASFILLKIYKSPLLNTVKDYQLIKKQFNEFYNEFVCKGSSKNRDWIFLNEKFLKILTKFDSINNLFLINQMKTDVTFDSENVDDDEFTTPEFALIKKMKNYLVSSISYEMIWSIHENEKNQTKEEVHPKWETFGLDERRDHKVIQFIMQNESIFG